MKPEPANRRSNASIQAAVRAAQATWSRALADARPRALRLAAGAGLTLGTLQSISDAPASPFGQFGPFGESGTFGPGRFCGTVPRFRTGSVGSASVPAAPAAPRATDPHRQPHPRGRPPRLTRASRFSPGVQPSIARTAVLGLAVVSARHLAVRVDASGRAVTALPALSALVICGVGCVLTLRALQQLG